MYSREIEGNVRTFEPSGGLLHASLVMQDEETDSYWSIISDEAIHGEAKGQRLRQLPGAIKTTWDDWRNRHPDTLILSVEGKEHDPRSPYDRYFESAEGFRKKTAEDDRLADKAEVFGFHFRGEPHAVDHAVFRDGGAVVTLDDRSLFLYREAGDSHYRSTVAFLLAKGHRAERSGDGWTLSTPNGRSLTWDAARRDFGVPTTVMRPMSGFDTYWYIWSLTNADTELVTVDKP